MHGEPAARCCRLVWGLSAVAAAAAWDARPTGAVRPGDPAFQWHDVRPASPSLRRPRRHDDVQAAALGAAAGALPGCAGGDCGAAARLTLSRDCSLLMQLARQPQNLYSRISVDASYSNVWEELLTFPERKPRIFSVLLATVKTWLADVVVQVGGRGRRGAKAFDWNRSAAFTAFGFLYVGCAGWLFYVTLFSALCPRAIFFANAAMVEKLHDRAGQIDLFKQVVLDNFVIDPLIYFPIFYAIKEAVRTGSFGGTAVASGLRRYRRHFWADNIAGWAFWIPTDCVIYAAPMFLRMPLDHGVSFLWTMLLSAMRGHDREDGKTDT